MNGFLYENPSSIVSRISIQSLDDFCTINNITRSTIIMSESKFYVTLLIFAFVACNQDLEAPQKHHRVRRYLTFQNGTRILVSTRS